MEKKGFDHSELVKRRPNWWYLSRAERNVRASAAGRKAWRTWRLRQKAKKNA